MLDNAISSVLPCILSESIYKAGLESLHTNKTTFCTLKSLAQATEKSRVSPKTVPHLRELFQWRSVKYCSTNFWLVWLQKIRPVEFTGGVRLLANPTISKPQQVRVLHLEQTKESFIKSSRPGLDIGWGLWCVRSNCTKQRQRKQCHDDIYFLASLLQPPLSCYLQALDEGWLVPWRLRLAVQPAWGQLTSCKARPRLVWIVGTTDFKWEKQYAKTRINLQ